MFCLYLLCFVIITSLFRYACALCSCILLLIVLCLIDFYAFLVIVDFCMCVCILFASCYSCFRVLFLLFPFLFVVPECVVVVEFDFRG